MPIDQRLEEGKIFEGAIRYVLMRPDVLMGVARHMGPEGDFYAALEASAFENAQASFQAYKAQNRFADRDFLESTCAVAGGLGWGAWSVAPGADGARIVTVKDSPFAAGHGPAQRPVCAPITGVLRALALVGYGGAASVQETQCGAQGAPCCCFRLDSGA